MLTSKATVFALLAACGIEQIDSCSTVLACVSFTKKDGVVTCTH